MKKYKDGTSNWPFMHKKTPTRRTELAFKRSKVKLYFKRNDQLLTNFNEVWIAQ